MSPTAIGLLCGAVGFLLGVWASLTVVYGRNMRSYSPSDEPEDHGDGA